MADKGIINNRKASITFSIFLDGSGEPRDLVIVPGRNRLTPEQFAALEKNRFFQNYLKKTAREELEASQDDDGNPVTKKVAFEAPAELEIVDLPSTASATAPVVTPVSAPVTAPSGGEGTGGEGGGTKSESTSTETKSSKK